MPPYTSAMNLVVQSVEITALSTSASACTIIALFFQYEVFVQCAIDAAVVMTASLHQPPVAGGVLGIFGIKHDEYPSRTEKRVPRSARRQNSFLRPSRAVRYALNGTGWTQWCRQNVASTHLGWVVTTNHRPLPVFRQRALPRPASGASRWFYSGRLSGGKAHAGCASTY